MPIPGLWPLKSGAGFFAGKRPGTGGGHCFPCFSVVYFLYFLCQTEEK